MLRKLIRLSSLCAITLLIVVMIRPYHDGVFRFGIPLSLITSWVGSCYFLRHRPVSRALLLIIPVIALLPFILPAKPIDRPQLRADYVSAMKSYIGTPYVWGGEGPRGIDCSGLPRRALRDALLKQGLQHANGTAFRQWAVQWWFDTSAKAMSEGYHGFTRPVDITGQLSRLDFSRLDPGDLAVTADGRHVMIYIGQGDWIQAEPGAGKVIISHPGADQNIWLQSDVSIHRWTILE